MVSSRATRSASVGATTAQYAKISSWSFVKGDAARLTGLNAATGAAVAMDT